MFSTSITITQPASTLACSASASKINCFGGVSLVTITATGGTAPYSGVGSFSVAAGTYTYTVTDSVGSAKSTTITIIQPAAINLSVTSGNIIIYGTTTSITATATGGTGAPSNFNFSLNNGTYQTSGIFPNVLAGTHNINAKDSVGCIVSKSIIIKQPSSLLSVSASVTTPINCNGGTARVNVTGSGGTPPYTGTGTFSPLAGTYTYTIKDSNLVSVSTTITITQPAILSATITTGTITVVGAKTTATVNNTAGGTAPYSYSLDNGVYQTSNIFSNVAGGNHTIVVKDANGCTISKPFAISQPLQIVLVSKTDNTCKNIWNGSIVVSANGGVPPYKYQINAFGYGTNNTFINLGPNTFQLYAKDAVNTVSTFSVTILPSNVMCTVAKGNFPDSSLTQLNTINTSSTDVIFPNPSTNVFNLNLNSIEKTDIFIYNNQGKIIDKIQSTGKNKISFGNQLSPGIYFLKLRNRDRIQTIKLIKSTVY